MVDHTKQHANISLCFHRAEKNQKVRIILHLVEAMRDYLFLRIFKISEVRHHADAWFFAIKIFKKLL